MSSLAIFHALSFPSLLAVLVSGVLVLKRSLRRLTLLEFVAVLLSIGSAGYWLVASYLLSNIATCRADSSLCLFGTVYQLLRNLALLVFHLALRRRASATD